MVSSVTKENITKLRGAGYLAAAVPPACIPVWKTLQPGKGKREKKKGGKKRKKKRWEGEAIKESNPLSRKRKRERRALLHYLAGGPGRGAALGSEGKRPPRPGTFCPRGAALPRRGAVRNPRGRSSAPALTCAAPFSLRFEEQQMRTLPSPPPPPPAPLRMWHSLPLERRTLPLR